MHTRSFFKRSLIEQDFELNIAPVIDCFVVLIAFVLISTAFASIGILDAVVAGGTRGAATESARAVVIEMKADRSLRLKQGSGGSQVARIRPASGSSQWNMPELKRVLAQLKARSGGPSSAVIIADNSISYRDVMSSMDTARSELGNVTLGGF